MVHFMWQFDWSQGVQIFGSTLFLGMSVRFPGGNWHFRLSKMPVLLSNLPSPTWVATMQSIKGLNRAMTQRQQECGPSWRTVWAAKWIFTGPLIPVSRHFRLRLSYTNQLSWVSSFQTASRLWGTSVSIMVWANSLY